MYVVKSESRICQGDIVEDFQHKFIYFQNEEKAIILITLPYAIVLSQDCDLEQDYHQRKNASLTNDKFMQSILICPGYIAERFKRGEHLRNMGLIMNTWGGDKWKDIKSNQNQRFHYFPENTTSSMPEIVVDFKHYYTIPREDIYALHKEKYKISIAPLFREDISLRFATYLARIGLPIIQDNNIQSASPEGVY